MTNEGIQRKLLAVKNLDLDKSVDIASALKVATKNAKDIQKEKHSTHTTALAIGVKWHTAAKVRKQRTEGQMLSLWWNPQTGRLLIQESKMFPVEKWDTYLRCVERKPVCDNRTHLVNDTQQPSSMTDVTQLYSIYEVTTRSNPSEPPITMEIGGASLEMELDTGATFSLISEVTYNRLWGKQPPPLKPTQLKLRTYTGEPLKACGEVTVLVRHQIKQWSFLYW